MDEKRKTEKRKEAKYKAQNNIKRNKKCTSLIRHPENVEKMHVKK